VETADVPRKGQKESKHMMSDKPDTATKGNPAPAAKPASVTAGQSDRQAATIRYIDRPDIEEIFADSVSGSSSMGRRCASSSA